MVIRAKTTVRRGISPSSLAPESTATAVLLDLDPGTGRLL
jgi:hypothetical protein